MTPIVGRLPDLAEAEMRKLPAPIWIPPNGVGKALLGSEALRCVLAQTGPDLSSIKRGGRSFSADLRTVVRPTASVP